MVGHESPVSLPRMLLPSHSALMWRRHLLPQGMKLFLGLGKLVVGLLCWNRFPGSSCDHGHSKILACSIVGMVRVLKTCLFCTIACKTHQVETPSPWLRWWQVIYSVLALSQGTSPWRLSCGSGAFWTMCSLNDFIDE